MHASVQKDNMKSRQTEREQIENMPSSVLFDLARNESARWEARKAATTLLVDRADPRTKHVELAVLVQQIAQEVIGGTQSLPEQREFEWKPTCHLPPETWSALSKASEAEFDTALHSSPPVDPHIADPASNTGPFHASVTTKTMFQEEVPPLEPPGPAPVATGDVTNDTFKFRSSEG